MFLGDPGLTGLPGQKGDKGDGIFFDGKAINEIRIDIEKRGF